MIGRFGPRWAYLAVDLTFVGHLALMWSGLANGERQLVWPTARAVSRALPACVPMVACVLVTQAIERCVGPVPPVRALCVETLVGAFGYLSGAALFARETSTATVGVVIGMIRPSAGTVVKPESVSG